MTEQLNGKRVALLVADGFEQVELTEPKRALEEAGATARIVSPADGRVKGWQHTDWGDAFDVDVPLDSASETDFDALVLPGGQINPDILRTDPDAVGLVRDFVARGLVVAAICHAPWLLVEAGVAEGREMTSYHSIATDVKNAGGNWQDKPVVVSNGIVTSRNPGDLEAFVASIVEEVEEGRHARDAA